jgi:hypothetical protein
MHQLKAITVQWRRRSTRSEGGVALGGQQQRCRSTKKEGLATTLTLQFISRVRGTTKSSEPIQLNAEG